MTMRETWNVVRTLIVEAETSGAVIGVSISTTNGESFGYNDHRRFRAASTMKIPVMVSIFRLLEQGLVSTTDTVTISPEMWCAGTGVLGGMHPGITVTISDLLYLMVSVSDNVATNILMDIVDVSGVSSVMRELGMHHSTVARKVQGFAARGKQVENWAVPVEYTALVRSILDGSAAGPDSCMRMKALLEKQQDTARIGRYVPETVRWGSKTGTVENVVNDVGFIESDVGVMCISVYCENMPDMYMGEQLIGDISREALAIMVG